MAKINKKFQIDQDVYSLALDRMRLLFDRFDKIVVSFSGGKDSTACLNIALTIAREQNRLPLDVYTFDEEAIPYETVEYMERVRQNPDINFKWFCVQLEHRNACSRKESHWYTWDEDKKDLWCRPMPDNVITHIDGFVKGDAIPELTPKIWTPDHGTICNVMGIRTQESMTRYRAIACRVGYDCFTVPMPNAKWIQKAYPVYDWTAEDVWRAPHIYGWDYNRAYDLMQAAGMSINDARCAPPYGEQPIRGLWVFKTCWADLWEKMVNRVPGAATAARYANTDLYGIRINDDTLPEGETWESFTAKQFDRLDERSKVEVGAVIEAERQHHRNLTKEPLTDDEPHRLSGICWKHLYVVVAAGGDKLQRQSQKLHKLSQDARLASGAYNMKTRKIGKVK